MAFWKESLYLNDSLHTLRGKDIFQQDQNNFTILMPAALPQYEEGL